ncbi:peroxide stress protein YaaA [Streptococcus sp. E29BA]|uniref:peroxide stress protein YaaA n=1 Tax=Streptococcus sp. E29BA TaxID=3278716 RepID=UPI00359CC84F
MKFLIPTAKEMVTPNTALPQALLPQTKAIIEQMKQKTVEQLSALYKITPTAAQKEWQRWQDLLAGTASSYPAIQLFNGLMYRQIDRENLDYLAEHVLITSALYGVIGATFPIAEHRLDFQQHLKIDGHSLKTYWRPLYDQAVSGEYLLISLLSSEFETVFSPTVQERFVRVLFHEEKAGQLKTHSTISKKGRGLLLKQAQQKNVNTLEQLKQLSFEQFNYREELSSPQQLVFVRKVD